MGETRDSKSGGFVSRGPQPRRGDPSGADQSLPKPSNTPAEPAQPRKSEPVNPKNSLRVCRFTENSTQPEREEETEPRKVQTRWYGSELDRWGPDEPDKQAVHQRRFWRQWCNMGDWANWAAGLPVPSGSYNHPADNPPTNHRGGLVVSVATSGSPPNTFFCVFTSSLNLIIYNTSWNKLLAHKIENLSCSTKDCHLYLNQEKFRAMPVLLAVERSRSTRQRHWERPLVSPVGLLHPSCGGHPSHRCFLWRHSQQLSTRNHQLCGNSACCCCHCCCCVARSDLFGRAFFLFSALMFAKNISGWCCCCSSLCSAREEFQLINIWIGRRRFWTLATVSAQIVTNTFNFEIKPCHV